MTGHNHYPSCTCGWCVGGGNHGSIATSVQLKPVQPVYTEQEKQRATKALKSFGATSYSRCFVNPNASCPDCGQSVYFYANSYGSRVYFDELGQPWTKHPCTDNDRPASTAASVRPARRAVSEIKEILEAEKKLDQRILPVSKKARKNTWKIAVVTEVEFRELSMKVLLEDISAQDHHQHCFIVYCDQQLLHEGDFVSRHGRTFSFLHPISLENIEVSDGELLLKLDALERDIDHNQIPEDIFEMVPSEKRHFSLTHWPNLNVPDEMRSVLQDFAKKGIVGAKLVSHYLNATGRTTAYGSLWTPRLAFFLISLSGVPQEKPLRHKNSRSPGKLGKRPPTKNKGRPKSYGHQPAAKSQKKPTAKLRKILVKDPSTAPRILTNDVDEWAQMLSRLGRVSRKARDE